MKVLITGSNGFIGSNLKKILTSRENAIKLFEFNRCSRLDELKEYCTEVDVIYHFAAVLRPRTPSGYEDNIILTSELLRLLKESGNKCPIMFSSSIQAVLNNPYAESKRKEEKMIINYGLENKVNTFVFRLPNLFGRLSKPNYTSVIATFCYNTINNFPIIINEPGRKIEFAEIQEALSEIIEIVESNEDKMANRIISTKKCYSVSLGELAYYMGTLKNTEGPQLNRKDNFYAKLYETYLYYKNGA